MKHFKLGVLIDDEKEVVSEKGFQFGKLPSNETAIRTEFHFFHLL